jgi:hypothetical protein
MVIKVFATQAMTLPALVAAVQDELPPDEPDALVAGVIGIAQAATADAPAYAIVTVAADDMGDVDVALYEMMRNYPLDYEELAEKEYLHIDEE